MVHHDSVLVGGTGSVLSSLCASKYAVNSDSSEELSEENFSMAVFQFHLRNVVGGPLEG